MECDYGVISVRQTRKEILPGVFLTCLQTDKFKTGLLSVNLLTRLCREKASQNTLIPSVLRRGTVHYGDMDALASRLDSLYGAKLEPISRKYGEIQAVGFYASFVDDAYLPEGRESLLGDMAALLGEVLLYPNTRGGLLLPQYVESEKEKLLEDIRARVNDKIAYSSYRLTELMCAAEDYAVDILGTVETAERIGYVALTKQYRQLIAAAPIEIFYCGTAEPGRVEEAIRDGFISLPRGELSEDIGTDVRMNTLEAQPRYFTETMDVTQGKLAVGFRLGECMEQPDIPAIRVMNAVFGGGVSSKLFMNVREKLSLCYYASSGVDIIKGVMLVISGIEQENYEKALEEIFRQLDAVRAGDITEEELAAAKISLSGDLLSKADSAGELEDFWMKQNILGLEYGPDELAALIEDVTVRDVMEIAGSVRCDMVYFMRGSAEDDHEQN